MKSQGGCQNFAWGFYARNGNTRPQRGTIPPRELPCSSKTGYGNNNTPQSNRAPLIFLKRSFRKGAKCLYSRKLFRDWEEFFSNDPKAPARGVTKKIFCEDLKPDLITAMTSWPKSGS